MSSLTKPLHSSEVAVSHAVASRPKPFTCDAYTLHCLLVARIAEMSLPEENSVVRSRAEDLAGKVALVLVWVRDHKGVTVDLQQARFTAGLQSLCTLVRQRRFLARDGLTGRVSAVAVDDMPEPLIRRIRAYLAQIPGYDTALPYDGQITTQSVELYGHVLSILTRACSEYDTVPFWA